jgi:hypothetical protein
MYALLRTDQRGGYVAKEGLNVSYTFDIRKVRKFMTKEDAEMNRCPGNEVVVPIDCAWL